MRKLYTKAVLAGFSLGIITTTAILGIYIIQKKIPQVQMVNPIPTVAPKTNIEDTNKKTGDRQVLTPSVNQIYFGAFPDFGPTEDTVTQKRIESFQTLVNKDLGWAYFSNNWFDGITFPTEEVELLQANNITPYIRLMPRENFSTDPSDHQYTMERIADGEFDEEITQWAITAKNTEIPLILEFGTEVNGNWFPWNGERNGQDTLDNYGDPKRPDGPEKFIAAYRHIIELFRAAGTQNITWVYHINSSSYPKEEWNTIWSYYPGDSYIDWIGVSVYGAQNSESEWISFSDAFDDTYQTITTKSNKPLMIAEFAVHEVDEKGLKAEWIQELFENLRNNKYPKVSAISYWHSNWEDGGMEHNLRLDTSSSALKVFKSEIAADQFTSKLKFESN